MTGTHALAAGGAHAMGHSVDAITPPMPVRESEERQARAALSALAVPADARVGRMLAQHGAPATLERLLSIEAGLRVRARALWGAGLPLDSLMSSGMRMIIPGEAEWPTQVMDLEDTAPYALWAVGEASLRLLALRSIAMVGARAASAYGERIAREWAGGLAECGWTIVSGGAFGIDAAAHRGALHANGVTICVLASGADVAYPRAHGELLARIADQGVVVSEAPPGTPARRHRFLTRNRLIAVLSRATVVVEAARRSGTTATANAAFLANRPVAAVPGPVGSLTSAGCHRLIREGTAVLVTSVNDVIDVVDPHARAAQSSPGPAGGVVTDVRVADDDRTAISPTDDLPADVLRVFDALRPGRPMHVDAVLAETGLAPRSVAAALGDLAARGLAASTPSGWCLTSGVRRR